MLKIWDLGSLAKCSSFSCDNGIEEYFLSVYTEKDLFFRESLEQLFKEYEKVLQQCGLSASTQIFGRFYLSDIVNQKQALEESEIFKLVKDGAYSLIQQCPLNGGGINLLSYHIKNGKKNINKELIRLDDEHWRNAVKITGDHYSLLWTGNLSGYGTPDSFDQTNEIFSTYNELINNNGMTLLKNAIRTWIYVRDIDNNYQGMVEARKDYFDEQGLTKESRYITSTGIEGKMKEVHSLVSMDALAVDNIKPEQIVRLEALEYLCPTHVYGITFERGNKIVFGDRSHFYISGTASIDKKGDIVHPYNIKKQTIRTLENIAALLAPHGADLKDMAYLIVYIRNITEVNKVLEVLRERVEERLPIIVVEGAVCRPSWLVEIEGVGVKRGEHPYPNFF